MMRMWFRLEIDVVGLPPPRSTELEFNYKLIIILTVKKKAMFFLKNWSKSVEFSIFIQRIKRIFFGVLEYFSNFYRPCGQP